MNEHALKKLELSLRPTTEEYAFRRSLANRAGPGLDLLVDAFAPAAGHKGRLLVSAPGTCGALPGLVVASRRGEPGPQRV